MTPQAFELTIGLPQTNYRGLAEPRLLMEACHVFWQALGEAIGRPISALRSAAGDPVYATIVYIDERFPDGRTLDQFRLDDRLRLFVELRAIRNLAVEEHRRYRRLGGADVEAFFAQAALQGAHDGPEAFAVLGVVANQLQALEGAYYERHGQRFGKNLAAHVVAQIFNNAFLARYERANAGHALREGVKN